MDNGVAGSESDVAAIIAAIRAHWHSHRRNEVAWHRPFRLGEVFRMREPGPANIVSTRRALVDAKANDHGCAHLDRGAAAFRIALREMGIADRIERAVDIH